MNSSIHIDLELPRDTFCGDTKQTEINFRTAFLKALDGGIIRLSDHSYDSRNDQATFFIRVIPKPENL